MRSLIILVLVPALLFGSCNALQPRRKMPTVVDGDVLWVPNEYQGQRKIVVWRNYEGRLMVFAGPEYTYQDATDVGISANRSYSITTRWIFVSKNPLEGAKTEYGWRNPWMRSRYPDLIFREGQGERGTLEIFSNGAGGYMVVVTVIGDADLPIYPPRENIKAEAEATGDAVK